MDTFKKKVVAECLYLLKIATGYKKHFFIILFAKVSNVHVHQRIQKLRKHTEIKKIYSCGPAPSFFNYYSVFAQYNLRLY